MILVFAITGSSAAFLSKPILSSFGVNKDNPWEYYSLYLIIIFPVYQLLLVSFGFLFGQFTFFWAFEKKILIGCGFGFLFSKKNNPK
ncbi:DUF6787 family protein [Flavobacterium sp.]|uniref:DUF6787 family protein n=1 Tax=Flavobacterium sp. TaxID=239 RepID=UPI0025DD19F1|nr:DUF6787 family protein [Flavobacterium sp.]